jgi:hypothetical protein
MVSIHTVVSVITCGFLLCLGLSGNAASAADEMKAGQSAERIGGQAGLRGDQEKLKGVAGQSAERIGGQAGLEGYQLKGGPSEGSKTIKGEVLGVEGDNLFVKGQDE